MLPSVMLFLSLQLWEPVMSSQLVMGDLLRHSLRRQVGLVDTGQIFVRFHLEHQLGECKSNLHCERLLFYKKQVDKYIKHVFNIYTRTTSKQFIVWPWIRNVWSFSSKVSNAELWSSYTNVRESFDEVFYFNC